MKAPLMGRLIGPSYRSARGGSEQPAMQFHQHVCGAPGPKEPILIQDEGHTMEHYWYGLQWPTEGMEFGISSGLGEKLPSLS